jgi:hypothetical protein
VISDEPGQTRASTDGTGRQAHARRHPSLDRLRQNDDVTTYPVTDLTDPVDQFFDRLGQARARSRQRSYRRIEAWTKEKYPNGYLSHSTVNDWFRKNQVPEWPEFCILLECFGEDVADWKDLWWHAYNKQQPGQKTYPEPPATGRSHDELEGPIDGHSPPNPQDQPLVFILGGDRELPKRPRRWPLIISLIGVLAGLVAGGTYLISRPAPTDPGRGTGADRCMQVVARNTRVFVAQDSKETWTTWTTGTKFWADTEIQNSRYRTPLHNGRDGWITSNSKYVSPAHGCP